MLYSSSVHGYGFRAGAAQRHGIFGASFELSVMLIQAVHRGWKLNASRYDRSHGRVVTLTRGTRTEIIWGLGFTRLNGLPGHDDTNKPLVQRKLDSGGVPVPRGTTSMSASDLHAAWETGGEASLRKQLFAEGLRAMRFPVVLKPSRGWGGNGVVIGIEDMGQLVRAVCSAIKSSHTSTSSLYVEEMVGGETNGAGWQQYRIATLYGKPVAVYRRLSRTLPGNGRSTVSELLQMDAAERTRIGWHTLANKDTLQNMMSPDSVTNLSSKRAELMGRTPAKGDSIGLGGVVNIHSGGTAEFVPRREWVNANLDELCRRVHAALYHATSSTTMGIDFMTQDINASFRHGFVNEVNVVHGMGLPFKAAGQHCPFWLANQYLDALHM